MPVGVVSPVLVGRDDELQQLERAVARTVDGGSGVVLIGGDAGVGKSRLLQAALADAAGGQVWVLSGGCIELGGEGLPFVPLVQALRGLVRVTPPADLDRLLGPARQELGRLLPELAIGGSPLSGTTSTAQLFELVLGVLGRLGEERPLVLVVEDLHWADRSTLDLVAFLVRAVAGLRVLLVLTYRSDEVDRRSPLRPLLSGWERLREVERIQLTPFDRAQVRAQVGGILGEEPAAELVDLLLDRSEGNAFFVEELLRTVRDGASEQELPASLRDVLLTRVERLSPSAQRLLRTAAAAGRGVPERLLAAVAGVPSAVRHEGLREAVDASLLVVDGTGLGYAFRHALTRDAVYEDLLPGERVELHTSYAEVLDREPELLGDDGASLSATLALHWYAAHDNGRALGASVRAGTEAMAAFAPAEAGRHLERALELWRSVPDPETAAGADEVEVLRLAAQAADFRGDPERALPMLARALDLVDPAADPERAALVVEQQVAAARGRGEDGRSLEALQQALDWLPRDRPSVARATVLSSLAGTLMRMGDARGPSVGREAVAAARASGGRPQEADALISMGASLMYVDDPAEGEAALREGVRLALQTGEHATALRGYVNLSDAVEGVGRHGEAAAVAREGIALAARVGLARSLGAFLTGNLVESLLATGGWAEAERLARDTMAPGLSGVFAANLHDLLGHLAAGTGRSEEALTHVHAARRQLGEIREAQFIGSLAYVEAEVARAAGDLDTALAVALGGIAETTPGWSARYCWPLVWLAARVVADRATRARDRNQPPPVAQLPAVTARLEEPEPGVPIPSAIAYRALTEAELARAENAATPSSWERAVQAWVRADEAWPLAYSRYRLAEALCGAGEISSAAAPLRESLRIAHRLGAQPLGDDAVALARRARIAVVDMDLPKVETIEPAVPFGLTEREREVLALVAAGESNGQIARHLYISPKTASVHVSNILAKLGVSGRVEAAGVAHRLGLTAT